MMSEPFAASLHRYRACGLTIDSDLPLPGLMSGRDDASSAVDVTIGAGDVPADLTKGVVRSGPNWQLAADAYLLRIPGLARFRITGGTRIDYATEGHTPPAELTAFLTGSVLGILLHLRGCIVLHASAVVVDGHAILFCGASGAGKSTMAAALGERGHKMLSDDLGVLTVALDGRLMVESDARNHKLWDEAVDALAINERRGRGVRHQINKFYVAPRVSGSNAVPVGAIYELEEVRGGQQLAIEPLQLADAASMIRQNAFRPRIVKQLGQQAEYFRYAALAARQGHIATLRRPLDFRKLDAVLDLLEYDWRNRPAIA